MLAQRLRRWPNSSPAWAGFVMLLTSYEWYSHLRFVELSIHVRYLVPEMRPITTMY